MATPVVQISKLTKSVGDRLLFGDIDLTLNEGDKVGLVARNGTGKSTFLRCVCGDEQPDSGEVIFRNGVRVGYLMQDPTFAPGATVGDVVRQGKPRDDADAAWDYENKLTSLLDRFGINLPERAVDTLSGGQRKRLALARTILDDPDLLILDEPTNHLDIEIIEWLENYLMRSRATLLMVTHDRYFLERICSKIVEIHLTEIFTVTGNYDKYLQRRQERLEAMAGELSRVKNTLRREQEWMNRQPQARGGKAKYRIDAYHDLCRRSKLNLREDDIKLEVKSSYIGSKIIEAEGLTKRFGNLTVLDDFTYTFARGEKIGIVGSNGVGKSSFVKLIQGLIPADSGRCELGETLKFGYYSQDGISFDDGKRVIDAITEVAPSHLEFADGVSLTPMQFLTRFLFTPADQQKYIGTLSGGERARLHLASVLMRQPNFLILDEPTNDLDIMTLGILEEYLRGFKGCVIIVSHDRFFLDNIVDHLFVFEGAGIVKDFPGNYSGWREYRQSNRQDALPSDITAEPAQPQRRQPERARRLTFKEKKELEALTDEIAALEEERNALENAFSTGNWIADAETDSKRYEAVKELLDEKELRWLELSEIND